MAERKLARAKSAEALKAPPETSLSAGFVRSAIGGVSTLYAAVAQIALGGLENLSDRRAERVSRNAARPKRAKSRRVLSPKAP